MNSMATPIYTARKLSVSVGGSRHSNIIEKKEFTWPEFIAQLGKPIRTQETQAEYLRFNKDKQDGVKDVGYVIGGTFEGNERKKTAAVARNLISLDCDHGDVSVLARITSTLEGLAYVVHSTHKHAPDAPRLRVYLPLSRPVSPEEYAPIARKLMDRVGIEAFDTTTDQVSRAMFWPSAPCDADYVFHVGEGAWVNPDVVLAEYADWRDIEQWPKSAREHKPKGYNAGAQAENPLDKSGLVGAFCRVYDVHSAITTFLPEEYTPTRNGRYSYAKGSTANGVVTYEDVWLFSHHETDPCSNTLVNAWDLVRLHKFGKLDAASKDDTPTAKLPSSVAMRKMVGEDKLVAAEQMRETMEGFAPVEDSAWLARLDYDQHGRPKPTLNTVLMILENDPAFRGLQFNDLTANVVKRSGMPWCAGEDPINGDLWADIDDLELRLFFERNYGKLQVTKDRAYEAVNLVAMRRKYHPIKEYLGGLSWDRVPRLDTWLQKYLGVADSEYSKAVARKVLCAAVARIYQPGCKFDYCMVLEGSQGKRKSSLLAALAGNSRWFSDDVRRTTTREVVEAVQGRWIIEVAELEVFGKTEIEQIKAFLSRTEDRARLAYDRRVTEHPRQCVLIGTTNNNDYLKDHTGNRRFWPVNCEVDVVDVEGLVAERDQLWAEAVFRWKEGEPLYLSPELEAEAREAQEERRERDPWVELIEDFLERPIAIGHWDKPITPFPDLIEAKEDKGMVQRDMVATQELWVHLSGKQPSDAKRGDYLRIRRCMSEINGWSDVAKDVKVKGSVFKAYLRLER